MKYSNQYIKCLSLIASLFFTVHSASGQPANDFILLFDRPATSWESEGLPIGNGRLGAMMMGGTNREVIQFNEHSLWSGDNNWDGEYETGDHGFGSYRNFGEIRLLFDHNGFPQDYQRQLDILNGLHQYAFTLNDIIYHSEAFASYPDQAMVFRYFGSERGSLSGTITLSSAQGAITHADNSTLGFEDSLANGLRYGALCKIIYSGGECRAEDGLVRFVECDTLTLLLAARTNYLADFNRDWRSDWSKERLHDDIDLAERLGYQRLKERHINDFCGLTKRVTLNLPGTNVTTLPLPQRLDVYRSGKSDVDLERLLFHYGRYLLISSSRQGGLPANLQGLWNHSNTPPWASDYHSNINLQMNYWPAEVTQLSECHLPLFDFIEAAAEPCRRATRRTFGDQQPGWTCRTSQSIFGGNGWEWNIPASAWYALHYYEHWAFTNDTVFLMTKAIPMLHEICQFWQTRLKISHDGLLMAPDGWSPEHGPREDGVMHDQQIVWELFNNYLRLAKVANLNGPFEAIIAEMQLRMAPNLIGKWGQLQEWQTDRDDPADEHRHTSHLFAVYPGKQISREKTPELAKAAIVSLLARSGYPPGKPEVSFDASHTTGDSRRSWTWPWRAALWARLHEADKAEAMLQGLITFNLLDNLFANHPPFQIDGNFGITAAIAEMLLQSHDGIIELLPALPHSWSEKGSFTGLKARGNIIVDCEWEKGKVTSVELRSTTTNVARVKINGQIQEMKCVR